MTTATSTLLKVTIDPARLAAWIQAPKTIRPQDVDAAQMKARLTASKLMIDQGVQDRIKEFIELLAANRYDGSPFLVAEGKAAVPGRPSGFCFEGQDAAAPEAADFDSCLARFSRIVAENAIIGKLLPAEPATPGRDVHGMLIPVAPARTAAIKVGAGAKLSTDGVTVTAVRAGRVVAEADEITVRTINAHQLSNKSGAVQIEDANDLLIQGVVPDGTKILCEGSVVVQGTVEAAQITVSHDCLVNGGAIGQSKGLMYVGRDAVVKFCADANIRCERDCFLGVNALNSKIWVNRSLVAPTANLIGGEITVMRSLLAGALGSNKNVPTMIQLSPITMIAEMDRAHVQHQARVQQILSELAALNAKLRGMGAAERERIESLTGESHALKTQIARHEKQKGEVIRAAGDGAHIRVLECIHEAVTIVFGDRTYRFDKPVKGPVRIELQKVKNATELVTVDEKFGTVSVLKAKKLGAVPSAPGRGVGK